MEDPLSEEERATTDGESEVEEEADEADLPPEEHGARRSHICTLFGCSN